MNCRRRSAISNGVNCSVSPEALASTQRMPASAEIFGELAELRGQRARAARAIGGARAGAEALELLAERVQSGLDRRQRLEEGVR